MVVGVLLTAFFYLYFAGRLAYTFLQAGLYLVAVLEIGTAAPTTVFSEAKELFAAIVVGVFVADLVNWLVGSEADLGLQLGGYAAVSDSRRMDQPKRDALGDGARHARGGARDRAAPRAIGHFGDRADCGSPSAGTDREGRTAAIGIDRWPRCGGWPHLFWSDYSPIFRCSCYWFSSASSWRLTSRSPGGPYGYAGLQMGLVVPMLVASAPIEFGSVTPAEQRFEGIILGLVASILVAGIWPSFPTGESKPALPPPPVPAMPGETRRVSRP